MQLWTSMEEKCGVAGEEHRLRLLKTEALGIYGYLLDNCDVQGMW